MLIMSDEEEPVESSLLMFKDHIRGVNFFQPRGEGWITLL